MADLDWLWDTKLSFLVGGSFMKAPPVLHCLEHCSEVYSWVQHTENWALQMEIRLLQCLKRKQKEEEEKVKLWKVVSDMIDEGEGMKDGWGQTIQISPPRQKLVTQERSCRVKEGKSLPSWQECGYYHATAMGIKLSYFCHIQLPAGDKRCLAAPVNLPATLGTCPHHVNWCMHLQHGCLILMQQKYCSCAKWMCRMGILKSSWINVLLR